MDKFVQDLFCLRFFLIQFHLKLNQHFCLPDYHFCDILLKAQEL